MEAWPPGGKQRPLNPLTVPAAHKKQRFSHEGFALAPNVLFPHSWLTRAALSGRRRGGGRGVGGGGRRWRRWKSWPERQSSIQKQPPVGRSRITAARGREPPIVYQQRLALKSPLTDPTALGLSAKAHHCQKVLGAAIKKNRGKKIKNGTAWSAANLPFHSYSNKRLRRSFSLSNTLDS